MLKKISALFVVGLMSLSLTAAPKAQAGLIVVGLTTLGIEGLTHHFNDSDCTVCDVAGGAVAFGTFLWIFEGFRWVTPQAPFDLPTPVSSPEAAISVELPFLNTSDAYTLGSLVRDKVSHGEVFPVTNAQLGTAYEVRLSVNEVLSVIGDGNYSPDQITQAERDLE